MPINIHCDKYLGKIGFCIELPDVVGPAIIEEDTSTLVVEPDTEVTVSGGGGYLLRLKERS